MTRTEQRLKRMLGYLQAAYHDEPGKVCVDAEEVKRKGAAAIGRQALYAEVDRHSTPYREDVSDLAELEAATGTCVMVKRKTPWKIGMFRFGQGRVNHDR